MTLKADYNNWKRRATNLFNVIFLITPNHEKYETNNLLKLLPKERESELTKNDENISTAFWVWGFVAFAPFILSNQPQPLYISAPIRALMLVPYCLTIGYYIHNESKKLMAIYDEFIKMRTEIIEMEGCIDSK